MGPLLLTGHRPRCSVGAMLKFLLGVVVTLVVVYFFWYDAKVQRIMRGED